MAVLKSEIKELDVQKVVEYDHEVQEEENTLEIIPYEGFGAFEHMMKTAMPFTLSNLSLAAYTIGNGIVLQKLGPVTVASGPLMSTFAYSVFSTVNGILYATGILIGNLNGAARIDPEKTKEIGGLIRRSWIIGTALAIPSLALFLTSGKLLQAAGIEPEVAGAVQDYFEGISYGLIPIFWNFSDQQLTLGLNQQGLTLISGTAYSIMAALFGYPLALGLFGLPKLGAAGIGYGASISGVLSLIGLRTYFLANSDYKKYGLYQLQHTGGLKDFLDFLKIGVPIGLQNLSEWGNLAILSLLAGKLGSQVLQATQASIIPLSAFSVLLLALAQATGVTIADSLGAGQAALIQGRKDAYLIAHKNAKTLGYVGLGIGTYTTAIVAALFAGTPGLISSLFIDTTQPGTRAILEMAQTMLIINGIGLMADMVRNVAGGGLRGFQDVLFVPIISFVMMSVIGLSLGGSLSIPLEFGPDWLFITRNIGILVAAVGILFRFCQMSPATEAEIVEVVEESEAAPLIVQQPAKNYLLKFFDCCLPGEQGKTETLTISYK